MGWLSGSTVIALLEKHLTIGVENTKHISNDQGYKSKLVDDQFSKAFDVNRSDILKPKVKTKKKVFPLVLDFNPRLPNMSEIIKSHSNLLSSSPELLDLFPNNSVMPAYRRTKNLKDILAPSKLKYSTPNSEPGCFRCNKKCDLCKNFLLESPVFSSCATGRIYKIKETTGCTSHNVIYVAQCVSCNLQYVGSTSTEFKVRFRNHKSSIRTNKKTCEVAIHFNNNNHDITDLKFIIVEAIRDSTDIDKKLLTREAYWTAQLNTLRPFGLNKRAEYRSKNRIHYK